MLHKASMRAAFLSLILWLPAAQVFAASRNSIEHLLSALLAKGEDEDFLAPLASAFGFQGDIPSKYFEKNSGPSSRCARVLLADGKPACLLLRTDVEKKQDTETVYYRVDLDGRLSKAFKMLGRLDENGQAVKGSAQDIDLDIQSSAVRSAFDRELRYWLRELGSQKAKITVDRPSSGPKAQPLAGSK